MTVSTNALFRSRFAKFVGLFTIIGFFTFQTAGQTPNNRSLSADEHLTVESSVNGTNAEVSAPSDISSNSDAAHRVLIPQTETKRKPNLPASIVIQASKEQGEVPSSGKDLVLTDQPSGEKKTDPSWRPFDHLPRKSRFLEEGDDANSKDNGHSEKFHWKPAILQSLLIQGFQHTYALVIQEKTRRALKGPFFKDYLDSVKAVQGWSDGNKFFTNYIAHPMQGGMTGFIFVQNHDRVKKQIFAESKQYWKDRLKAFAWSAAWSTNWELGPISQSSIGNVGLYGHQGYVDLVITPTVGTGWLLTEEALDRYIIRHIESKGRAIKMIARTFINPMRSVANLLRFKEPWYRDRPFGYTARTSARVPEAPSH